MRVTIERQDLLKSLNHVQSVVERRNTIPILSNLLIKADSAGVMLSATDLDIEIVEVCGAEVNQEGATTAPAMAAAKGWHDQITPGVLVGVLGYSLGTLIGGLLFNLL